MQITERSAGGNLLGPDGKLVGGGDLRRLEDKANSLVFQNCTHVIFDLARSLRSIVPVSASSSRV